MIEDYNNYKYEKKEWVQYFLQGALIGALAGLLFYSSLLGAIVLMPYGFFYVHNKKKELIQERKWQLNLEFRDGLASVSAALNVGYSVENAFAQAVTDLSLMYSPDSLILCEFKGIVHKIHMNRTVEEILKNLADRSGIEDIINFAEVFITAKRTGGDIVKIIRSTGNTIGDKIEIKREILTMITAKKFESNIMNLIPFCMILYLQVFSRGFLDPLYHNLFGILFMSILLVIYYLVSKITKKIICIEV